MEAPQYEVVVSAGSLRPAAGQGVPMPHRWTDEGVVVQADFTGAHLYHLAAAGCVLNDVYREAAKRNITIHRVQVDVSAEFGAEGEPARSITYSAEIEGDASDDEIKQTYRRLVRENHPDSLMARGVPPEFEKLANDKLAAINGAYEAIQKERDFH